MSWELFKNNLVSKLSNASNVPSIEYVAKAFADEYDRAIKNGGTIPDNIKVTSGNVEAMEKLFLAALQKGLSKTTPYDLVGEMGKGVKAYWATAQLAPFPLPIPTPIQITSGVTANIVSVANKIDDTGIWKSSEDIDSIQNSQKKLEEDDSDVVNNKVNEKEVDEEVKDMPSLDDNFNLYQIPDGLNNYRSAQIPVRIKSDGTFEGPYPDIIKKYGIKTIIRMNGDGSDGRKSKKWPITTKDTEKKMCEILGCTFYYINAHGPEEPGNGYQVTNKKITEILKQGNVLIHCAHGADRTGGHVAGYLKKTGKITDIDRLWDYTVKYNSWQYYIKQGKFFGTGYETYANIFYPQKQLIEKFQNVNFVEKKEQPTKTNTDKNNKPKILIVGDSITVDNGYTWSSLFKKAKTDAEVEILAIGGKQLITWMGPQLQAKLAANSYNKVYIYGGVNDAYSGRTASAILNALQLMVNLVVSKGGQAIVVTGYDAEIDMGDNSTKPTKLVKTKEEMEKLLAEYRSYQKSINTIRNATIVPKISIGILADGFHPTGNQPKKLYEHISKY